MKRKNNPAVAQVDAAVYARRALRSAALAAGLVFAIAAVTPLVPARAVFGQSRATVERTAQGKVVTKENKPVSGAVVYLQNSKTMAIKSYLTDDAGRFHFGQLAQNTDYEIWAESNGERSHSKNISSFNSKPAFDFTLKINKAEK